MSWPESVPIKEKVQAAIDRWSVEIEVFCLTNRSLACYGYLPSGVRILLGVIREDAAIRRVDDVIDAYLAEADPKLAAELLSDVDALLSERTKLDNYRFGAIESKEIKVKK